MRPLNLYILEGLSILTAIRIKQIVEQDITVSQNLSIKY
jgi:hypothetical protein